MNGKRVFVECIVEICVCMCVSEGFEMPLESLNVELLRPVKGVSRMASERVYFGGSFGALCGHQNVSKT